ncbi:MAG: hypothetical protein NTU76_01085 [Candidatus Taylorbacteria bacterium]|nr:hypothetical protein [Candidatus Taylorbacteria bacterium]
MNNEDNMVDMIDREVVEEEAREEDSKTETVSSCILQDGTLVEMLYDKKEEKTMFAVFKDGELKIRKTIKIGETSLKPHSPDKDLLKNDVILFPSKPEEYASQEELIEEIQEFIHKYLSVSESFEKIVSYYVLFSWVYDDFNELPYIRAIGDYGTGKSRFLKTVGSICYLPIITNGATSVSPIFRILNDFRGTLILDEADFRYSDMTSDMIKILNNGFAKGNPVLRSESNNNKSFDVKAFNVFGPKIIATRTNYKDEALESRMITEDMNLNTKREDIKTNIVDNFNKEALGIRNKLLMFRFKTKGKNILKSELEDKGIEPRLNQIAIPLMSIIDNQNVIEEIKKYIREYNGKIKADRASDYNCQILEVLCDLQREGNNNPTMKEVSDIFNLKNELGEKERFTSRKIGYFVRKKLGLKTKEGRDGYRITDDSKEKIEILKKRYGIESVDVVDIADIEEEEEIKEINIQELLL